LGRFNFDFFDLRSGADGAVGAFAGRKKRPRTLFARAMDRLVGGALKGGLHLREIESSPHAFDPWSRAAGTLSKTIRESDWNTRPDFVSLIRLIQPDC
jgi:hypothetical protein